MGTVLTKEVLFILGMRDSGIIINNPLKTGRYVYNSIKIFNNSKWLVELQKKLTSKWYRRTLTKNRFICWTGTVIIGSIIFTIWIWAAWKLYEIGIDISLLGGAVVLGIIAVGLYTFYFLDDMFPTNNWMLNINNRKRNGHKSN